MMIVFACWLHVSVIVAYFEIKPSQEHAHDIDIHMYENEELIGFVSYTKISLVPFYIIHNLYVYPRFRKKGYGKQLLQYVCSVIQQQGGTRAYIQPGPFEIVNGHTIKDGILHEQKMQFLVHFYQKYGFQKVNPVLTKISSVLYRLMHIPEDARYLMVKYF